jgi:hypothetical protein
MSVPSDVALWGVRSRTFCYTEETFQMTRARDVSDGDAVARSPQAVPVDGREPRTWYGVRTIYRWPNQGSYEERVTIWRASSFARAIELAEAEAREYESEDIEYVGFAQAYDSKIRENELVPSMEIFSLLRRSPLSRDDYLGQFFNSGEEIGG